MMALGRQLELYKMDGNSKLYAINTDVFYTSGDCTFGGC